MSKEIKMGKLTDRDITIKILKFFEDDIRKRLRKINQERSYDPRDDEMMNETYPED